jgi:hypothetical protein
MMLGRFDNQQMYYRRFLKAREDTAQRVADVKRQWVRAKVRGRFWRFTFYGLSAIWILMVLLIGITGHDHLLNEHKGLAIVAPVGGMWAFIIAVRAFFRGYGFLMSVIWGCLGIVASFAVVYLLRYIDVSYPQFFNWVIVLLTLAFMGIVHLTDFSQEDKTDSNFVKSILNGDDVKSSLLDPLYYTLKTKSVRYKSSKFGILDDLNDQMRGTSGETSIHYALCCIMMAILIGLFCIFSPALLDTRIPGIHQNSQDNSEEVVTEQIYETAE